MSFKEQPRNDAEKNSQPAATMPFMTPASPTHSVQTYLQSLQKELSRGDATEHTHRSALKSLIESAAPGLLATNEPKATQRENKPDYIVRRDSSVIGFVEAKDVDKSLKSTLKTNQLKRYLEALPNLLLTNYLDFIWFVGGEKRMEISLGELNGQHVAPAKDATARWDELIACFLAEVTPTLSSPQQLAKNLAGQTRLLRDLSLELLTAGDADLLEQDQSFRALLVPDLKPHEFADMYAQTAAYGLFTARVFAHTTMFGGSTETLPDSLKKNDAFSLEQAAYLIPKANPFLRQFFQHVASPNLNPQLRWLVEQIADSLRYTDMDKVLHRQGRRQGFEDPVFHFYETFLAEYDRSLRDSRGVFYSPDPVVDYIVRGVDWLLVNRFGKPDGLADPSALVLDPATGTATFLRKVIALIHQRVYDQGMGGAWPMYVRKRLLPRIFGFELMMAPYTVAHLKLALQLQESGFEFAQGERLHVYLTNTLDQLHQQTAAMLGQWIAKENEGAEKIKRDSPVVVVVGNPPYSGESRNKSDWIMQLLQTYKTEPEGGPLKERNSKWINNDYVKFIRFAHDRVKRTGHGIVAFISSNSFLDGPIFRGMRAQLMADFDEIYVLDLHGNGNRGEKTPPTMQAQGGDKNVFDILEGVCITFLVKLPNTALADPVQVVEEVFELTAPEPSVDKKAKHRRLQGGKVILKARIHHADLWGSRDYKYNWLETHGLFDTPWQNLQPALPQLLLVPRDESDAAEYEQGWKITEIFGLTLLGPNSHRDHFAVALDANEAQKRIHEFFDESISDQLIRDRYELADNRDWSLRHARSLGLKTAKPLLSVYRPFDLRYMLYGDYAFDYPRSEINDPLAQGVPALVTTKQTKEEFAALVIDKPAAQHKLVTPYDGSYVSPLYVSGSIPNLSPAFLTALAQALDRPVTQPHGLPEGVTPEDVLAYVYAVLHAPSYRSRYAGFLKSDFPRIPLSNQPLAPVDSAQEAIDFVATWRALLPLGRQLIDLHLLKNVPATLRVKFSVQGSNEVEKPRFASCNGIGRVWINATQYFDGVPADTWTFKVGGYQVCEKWLKDRKGRQLDFADIQHYGSVVGALTRTRELMREIDSVASGRLWPEAAVIPLSSLPHEDAAIRPEPVDAV